MSQSIVSYSFSFIALRSRQSDAKIRTPLLAIQPLDHNGFKSDESAITWSYQTIRASIYAQRSLRYRFVWFRHLSPPS